MTSLKTSIKTITYLSDIGCLEIQGASLDGFRRDDMVIVIIINISVTITPRGGYDLRIVLKENIAPESNIALNPQFLKELFLLM
ncbi:hypothetical protein VEE17_32450 [Escherichia coli]|nr:hypothetical protein VEE41_11590 [Escherichia coli]BEB63920.1 hypothetical protein VEE17_32450 [Escherichia coli]